MKRKKKIRIDYLGFYQDVLEKNRVTLEFELRNLTHDTIYLSEIHNLIAYKNGKKIKKEKINNGIGTPFVWPRLNKCPEESEYRNALCSKFALKLVKKKYWNWII